MAEATGNFNKMAPARIMMANPQMSVFEPSVAE
jgi:hypothetical protein